MANLTLNLRVWRQDDPDSPGRLVTYRAEGISPDMSFLEMLDLVNEKLSLEGVGLAVLAGWFCFCKSI